MTILNVDRDDNRQLQNVANIMAAANKVVVVTGAGISTNCGIPDFRSKEGLYALIQSSYDQAAATGPDTLSKLPPSLNQPPMTPSKASNIKGKNLFDSMLWKDPDSTSVFYAFIASLRMKIRDEVKATTPTHRFIRTLRDSQKLVRCYTQNIDGLEARNGLCTDMEKGKGSRSRFSKKSLALPNVPAKRFRGAVQDGGCEIVQLHGNLDVLRCTLCGKTCGWDEGGREALLLGGKAPECLSCTLQDQSRRDRGKRGTAIGSLRPNIVLYGEEHPAADAISNITTNDLRFGPDVLLILGTSLHVHGLKVLVKEFAKAVHARSGGKGKVVFVNLTKPPESIWNGVIDYWVAMDCDQWVESMKRHRPDVWHIQTQLQARTTKAGVSLAAKSKVKPTRPTDAEEKENIAPNPQPYDRKNCLQRPKQKSPLRNKESMCNAAGLSQSPVSGEKGVKRKHSMGALQLPTPPPSGHRRRFCDSADGEGLTPCETPSKRRKVRIVIHED
ncbi:MAG: hypothetical protein Q9195_001677 [Heterodermia aff. obscurata]